MALRPSTRNGIFEVIEKHLDLVSLPVRGKCFLGILLAFGDDDPLVGLLRDERIDSLL